MTRSNAVRRKEGYVMVVTHGNKVIALALLAAATTLSRAASTDSWPMYQANPEHTGYISQTLLPAQAQFAWSETAQASAPSGLAVANGLVLTTPTTYFNNSAPIVAQDVFRQSASGRGWRDLPADEQQ
jgi:hypothetical protein